VRSQPSHPLIIVKIWCISRFRRLFQGLLSSVSIIKVSILWVNCGLIVEKSRTLLEIDLKLDDLLEMHQAQVQLLDLRFVQLDVPKLIALLNKAFARKKN
jgi:hypothetical protein